MRTMLLVCLLMVLFAPLASASPESRDDGRDRDARDENRGGHGGERDDGEGRRDRDEKGDRREREAEQPEEHEIELDSELQANRTLLKWAFTAQQHAVESFEVYRSFNGESAQLIGTVDEDQHSFVDAQYSETGSYTYFVNAPTDSSQQSQSNRHTALVSCDWLSVSPFGNPPVLFHPECVPVASSDTS